MPFDYVFEGSPTLGIPYGPALGVDIATGILYVSIPRQGLSVQAGGGPPEVLLTVSNLTITGHSEGHPQRLIPLEI